jgi:glutaredoxin-like protein NrdH
VKEFLSREGHLFDARNVDEDDDAYRALTALGIRTVPVTVIGDRIVKGFDPAQLRSALADAGSPPDR